MANQFLKLRRSAVPGRSPSTSSLDFGEIALNTYDGLAFIKKSGSAGEEIVTLGTGTSGGSLTGSRFFIPVFNTTSSLITSSIYQSGSFTAIGATSSLHPNAVETFLVNSLTDSYNLISGHADIDNYVQLNIKNFSNGPSASADIVATADTGNEESNYINMGINSSGYTANAAVGGALDAYLYTTGENLLIGNVTEGKQIIFFNGGFNVIENASLWIHDQGTISINTDQFNTTNPPSLVVYAPNSTTNTLIEGVGQSNQFLQLAIANENTGSLASADIVAYNNIDPTNQGVGFIDMGISSTTFNDPVNYPGWIPGESYVYTDAPRMVIGSTSGSSQIRIFAGGINPITNTKLILNDSNQHEMTGSLSITNGITGSLFGTASWAQNALTASYVPASAVVGLNLSRIATGSITASVDVDPNNLFLIKSGSNTYFNIASNSDTTLYSNQFIIKNFTTQEPILTVSQSVVQFATQSSNPNNPAKGGDIWFTSTELYVGLN